MVFVEENNALPVQVVVGKALLLVIQTYLDRSSGMNMPGIAKH
jgi:hypothetical protein